MLYLPCPMKSVLHSRSVLGMPVDGLEYVPVFLVNPQPLTVLSVTAEGIVGLLREFGPYHLLHSNQHLLVLLG